MKTATILALIALVGCATTRVETVPLKSAFDADEVAFIHDKGTNTIKGSGFVRLENGGTLTCAGADVGLIPSGAYASERMGILYGGGACGARLTEYDLYSGTSVRQPPMEGAEYIEYTLNQRNTQCDVQGYFAFRDVAPGQYFVVTGVQRTFESIPGNAFSRTTQHFNLMDRVRLNGEGETLDIVLTQCN